MSEARPSSTVDEGRASFAPRRRRAEKFPTIRRGRTSKIPAARRGRRITKFRARSPSSSRSLYEHLFVRAPPRLRPSGARGPTFERARSGVGASVFAAGEAAARAAHERRAARRARLESAPLRGGGGGGV